jgi:hypothetical protein
MSTTPSAPENGSPQKPARSLATRFAVALIAFLSFGPLTTGLGLLLDVLPRQFPAIQHLYAAGPVGHAVWFGAGVLGVLTIVALLRAPRLAVVVCAAFAVVYVFGALSVWGQFTLGVWAAIAAVPLSIVAAVAESRRAKTAQSKTSG